MFIHLRPPHTVTYSAALKTYRLTGDEWIWCVSCFSHSCCAVEELLKEGKLTQVHSAGDTVHPGGEAMVVEPEFGRKLIAHIMVDQEAKTGESSGQLTSTFSFYLVRIPVCGMVPYIQDRPFPPSQCSMETPSQAYPEECLANAPGIY